MSLEQRREALLSGANPFFGPAADVQPARSGARDLAVLLTLYTHGDYTRPALNALQVSNRLTASGLPWFLAELAFLETPHVFLPAPNILLLRARTCLFQNERLLNVLARRLVPASYTKLLFLDADLALHPLPGAVPRGQALHWYDAAAALLDGHDVVQPFDLSGRLSLDLRHVVDRPGCGLFSANAGLPLETQANTHQPGYALAYRRQWLEGLPGGGLFDLAVLGDGFFLSAAVAGGFDVCWPFEPAAEQGEPQPPYRHCSPELRRQVAGAYWAEFGAYARAARATRPRNATLSHVMAVHYWHGRKGRRRYAMRHVLMANVSSLRALLEEGEEGLWELRAGDSEQAAALNETICGLFRERKDDDPR